MTFSRANPSPRYRELVELYRRMHAEGESFLNVPAEETFGGFSLTPHAHLVKELIEGSGSQSILDYGSGKGRQYDQRNVKLATGAVVESILDYWGVDYVHCYDPSYAPVAAVPQGRFDGVVCTDVLEHCPEPDLPWIVDELFAYADRFVFATVTCYPAMKRLPSGENAHCTTKPPEWWIELFQRTAARHPAVKWQLIAQTRDGPAGQERYFEESYGSPER
jgi:hypothetical protein